GTIHSRTRITATIRRSGEVVGPQQPQPWVLGRPTAAKGFHDHDLCSAQPARSSRAHHLPSSAPAKRACVVSRSASLTACSSPPPAPLGLRGVSVLWA